MTDLMGRMRSAPGSMTERMIKFLKAKILVRRPGLRPCV